MLAVTQQHQKLQKGTKLHKTKQKSVSAYFYRQQ